MIRWIFFLSLLVFWTIVHYPQVYGGQLAMCNDATISRREDCVGEYHREYFVTRLALGKRENRETPEIPAQTILVPRVWANPRNFDFDTIGNAMLALFEVLSLEGWLEVRWRVTMFHIFAGLRFDQLPDGGLIRASYQVLHLCRFE